MPTVELQQTFAAVDLPQRARGYDGSKHRARGGRVQAAATVRSSRDAEEWKRNVTPAKIRRHSPNVPASHPRRRYLLLGSNRPLEGQRVCRAKGRIETLRTPFSSGASPQTIRGCARHTAALLCCPYGGCAPTLAPFSFPRVAVDPRLFCQLFKPRRAGHRFSAMGCSPRVTRRRSRDACTRTAPTSRGYCRDVRVGRGHARGR